MKKLLACLIVFILIFSPLIHASATDHTARMISIHSMEGRAVTLSRDNDRGSTPRERQRLSEGHTLTTGSASHVHLQMDRDSILHMDEHSTVVVGSSGNNLSLTLQSGSVLVNVTEQSAGQTISSRVGNVGLGIRGTMYTMSRDVYGVVTIIMLSGAGSVNDVLLSAGSVMVVYDGFSGRSVTHDGTLVSGQYYAIAGIEVENLDLHTLTAIYGNSEYLIEAGTVTSEDISLIPDLVAELRSERDAQLDERNALARQIQRARGNSIRNFDFSDDGESALNARNTRPRSGVQSNPSTEAPTENPSEPPSDSWVDNPSDTPPETPSEPPTEPPSDTPPITPPDEPPPNPPPTNPSDPPPVVPPDTPPDPPDPPVNPPDPPPTNPTTPCPACADYDCALEYSGLTGIIGGDERAPWRLFGCGVLMVDEGFIQTTGTQLPWTPHRNAINTIVFTGPITAGESLSSLFSNMHNVTEIEGLSYFDTSNVTNMNFMFSTALSLTSLDLSGWDTSNVTEMHHMFRHTHSLTSSLDLSHFDTSNVRTMSEMFAHTGLPSLDLSGWNTGNVGSMGQMFSGSSNLTSLDLSGWDTRNTFNMYGMFRQLVSLNTLILGADFIFSSSPNIGLSGSWSIGGGTPYSAADMMANNPSNMAGIWVREGATGRVHFVYSWEELWALLEELDELDRINAEKEQADPDDSYYAEDYEYDYADEYYDYAEDYEYYDCDYEYKDTDCNEYERDYEYNDADDCNEYEYNCEDENDVTDPCDSYRKEDEYEKDSENDEDEGGDSDETTDSDDSVYRKEDEYGKDPEEDDDEADDASTDDDDKDSEEKPSIYDELLKMYENVTAEGTSAENASPERETDEEPESPSIYDELLKMYENAADESSSEESNGETSNEADDEPKESSVYDELLKMYGLE
ncbi:MAG: BspA family leucine-rich repeat surface protein [Oscillospiraceae bacterium]|nr:BspA family leucine-rich repeat surface protein [Oscillospiraceae bacterium]MCL2278169.1 BspA family leucine-rich repeat surface protein [Oscillospiraceae bacterium]